MFDNAFTFSVASTSQVPQWHGQEMMLLLHEQNLREREKLGNLSVQSSSGVNQLAAVNIAPVEMLQLRWRHVQALVRLTQVVHVLGDVITDWEAIMDSFEQLIGILLSSASVSASASSLAPSGSSSKDGRSVMAQSNCHAVVHEELTPNEVDRISQCIERFKGFTIFLSDAALVRLMTSLVALSLNALAVSATSSSQTSSGTPSASATSNTSPVGPGQPVAPLHILTLCMFCLLTCRTFLGGPLKSSNGSFQKAVTPMLTCPAYMIEALTSGKLNYSLHAAVEVAKINAFRMSCVWQMVTSHLRMMTTHKV